MNFTVELDNIKQKKPQRNKVLRVEVKRNESNILQLVEKRDSVLKKMQEILTISSGVSVWVTKLKERVIELLNSLGSANQLRFHIDCIETLDVLNKLINESEICYKKSKYIRRQNK